MTHQQMCWATLLAMNVHQHNMVGYEFSVTWVCYAKEPNKIRFCEKNCSNPKKEKEREWTKAKHVKHYFCT